MKKNYYRKWKGDVDELVDLLIVISEEEIKIVEGRG